MQVGVYELDRTNLIVTLPDDTYVVSFYEAPPKVWVLVAHVEDYDPMLGNFCLCHEVWSTTLVSYRPLEVLKDEIAQILYRVDDIKCPLELVSVFGGRLLGEKVELKAIGKVH